VFGHFNPPDASLKRNQQIKLKIVFVLFVFPHGTPTKQATTVTVDCKLLFHERFVQGLYSLDFFQVSRCLALWKSNPVASRKFYQYVHLHSTLSATG